jgi:hypothetical protein
MPGIDRSERQESEGSIRRNRRAEMPGIDRSERQESEGSIHRNRRVQFIGIRGVGKAGIRGVTILRNGRAEMVGIQVCSYLAATKTGFLDITVH